MWLFFGNTEGFDQCGCPDHNINCRNFEITDRARYPYDRVLTKGAVDHWRIVSGFDGHPFHIHINPFLVCPLPAAGSRDRNEKSRVFEPPFAHWRDTYLVNLDRSADFLTEYKSHTGDFVFHCHKLNHEDHGMMELIRICDPAVGGGAFLLAALAALPPELRGAVQLVGRDLDALPRLNQEFFLRGQDALDAAGLERSDAPIDAVTAIVRDYASYRDFMPHFRQSRVLAQRGDRAMVYMEVGILRDAHRLWAQMRVSTREENGRRIVDARMVEGNMTTFEARWELQSTEDGRTRARFRLMVDPDLPLPDAAVSSETARSGRNSPEAQRIDRSSPKSRERSSRIAPSAILSVRSTSPPKSAWPGVSMMLMVTSP